MADGTGPRRTAKRTTIGPKPFRVLTVPLQTNGEEVEGLFDSGDAPHPRAVDQLTDLAREAWLNLKGMGESGTFEFLVVPPKRTKMFPSEMWGPFAELARRSVERVLAGASPHETLPVPHAFNDWIIKFERTNNTGMSSKQALNQLRNALDKVKAQAQGDADLRRESAELLEGALSELRMPPLEDWVPAKEASQQRRPEPQGPTGFVRHSDTERVIGVGEAMRFTGLSRARIKQLPAEANIGEFISGRWMFSRKELQPHIKRPSNL